MVTCRKFVSVGHISTWVRNLIGSSMHEAVDYLSEFTNVELFQLGDNWYLNASNIHGTVHCKFK